jgi:polyphenol oxidase
MRNKELKIIKPNWPDQQKVNAFITLKNCNIDALKWPNNQFWMQQEHGTHILQATAIHCLPSTSQELPVGDGSYSTEKQVVCVVKTADCLPILIKDYNETFVAALHAGWKGLAQGIIDQFFNTIKILNIDHSNLLFWLGPAIGPLAFEVGEEVVANFAKSYITAFTKINNKYFANLYQIAKLNLYAHGITQSQVFSDNYCTYSQQDLFYSYRQNPQIIDRMFSCIWIN